MAREQRPIDLLGTGNMGRWRRNAYAYVKMSIVYAWQAVQRMQSIFGGYREQRSASTGCV